MKLKIKRLVCLTLAICILLFSSTCYASMLNYPELPCAGDGYDNYVVFKLSTGEYRCYICKYSRSKCPPCYSEKQDLLFFGEPDDGNDFLKYNLVDDTWVYDGEFGHADNFISKGKVIVMSTADVINYETGTVFFRQTESRQVLKITPLLLETLLTMIRGLIPSLALLLIGSAALWKAWRWFSKNLLQG